MKNFFGVYLCLLAELRKYFDIYRKVSSFFCFFCFFLEVDEWMRKEKYYIPIPADWENECKCAYSGREAGKSKHIRRKPRVNETMKTKLKVSSRKNCSTKKKAANIMETTTSRMLIQQSSEHKDFFLFKTNNTNFMVFVSFIFATKFEYTYSQKLCDNITSSVSTIQYTSLHSVSL